MTEVNLMERYPKSKGRNAERPVITDEDRRISKQFGKDYFDGDRRHGYGGFNYHERFWTDTVQLFRDYYHLREDAAILDIGCGKGFMLYDFMKLMPKARLAGLDISEYAVEHCVEPLKPFVRVGNARALPFEDKSFDLVIAINTIHNLPYNDCMQSVREIQRVARVHAFIMVDAWRTEEQRQAMLKWVLTAETMLHADDWLKLFENVGYTHDYYWWTVE
ncbi:MAG TPA: class I SAM-dependent methyltransferase [Terriglobia bacterium]|nr:class I SAM-dependent methyltransferase [Terriglobia bacterium]